VLTLAAGTLLAVSVLRYRALGVLAPDHAALDAGPELLAAAVVAIALGLSVLAHARAVEDAEGGRLSRRAILALAAGLAGLGAATLPLLSNDVFSLLAYVDLAWNSTVNPLTLPPPGLRASRFFAEVSPVWVFMPCVYGPLTLYVWAPVLTASTVLGAVAVAKLPALAATLAVIGLGGCLTRGRHADLAFLALSPVLWVEGAGQAHVDVLAAACIALFLWAGKEDRPGVAGLALGAAVASKLSTLAAAGLYIAWLLGRPGVSWRRRGMGLGGAVAGAIAVLVPVYAPFWVGTWTLRRPLQSLSWRWPTNTVFEFLFKVGDEAGFAIPGLNGVLTQTSAVLTLAVGCLGLVAALRARTFPDLAAVAALVTVVSLVATGAVFHPWYLLPCLPLALFLDPGWRRRLVVLQAVLLLDVSAMLRASDLHHDLWRAVTVPPLVALTVLAGIRGVADLRARVSVRTPPGTASA
jgi:hypothetical protein